MTQWDERLLELSGRAVGIVRCPKQPEAFPEGGKHADTI